MNLNFPLQPSLTETADIGIALGEVRSYKDLAETVSRIDYRPLQCAATPLTIEEVDVDDISVPHVPPDYPGTPVEITADGNCLPRAASLFAYHTQEMHEEMRYRIIEELVNNSEFYLSADLDSGGETSSASMFAMFSECFNGESFAQKPVRQIYEEELLSITKLGSYMGAWQVAALASVLGRPVYSVYPLYAAEVCRYLHRVFYPHDKTCGDVVPLEILWTNTQHLEPQEWLPNHFVLLIPK